MTLLWIILYVFSVLVSGITFTILEIAQTKLDKYKTFDISDLAWMWFLALFPGVNLTAAVLQTVNVFSLDRKVNEAITGIIKGNKRD